MFKASYTNHYRKGLIELLEALEFGSTNTQHAPVMEALELIRRYVPVGGVVPAELAELMSPRWTRSPSRATCAASRPRSRPAGARCRCWTC